MEQRQKSYLLNAFLLGVITGFYSTAQRVFRFMSSRGTCSPKNDIGHHVL